MTSRAILWARVSTEEQVAANQLEELRNAAKLRDCVVVEERILEGVSAWKPRAHDREIQRLYGLAESGQFDTLIVTALDRLSRRGVGKTIQILDRLEEAGVSVVSLRDDFTGLPPGPMRDIVRAVYAGFAQYESTVKSVNTIAGMDRARDEGVDMGRPTVTDAVDVEWAAAAYVEGRSWEWIKRNHARTIQTPAGGTKAPSREKIRQTVLAQHPSLAKKGHAKKPADGISGGAGKTGGRAPASRGTVVSDDDDWELEGW